MNDTLAAAAAPSAMVPSDFAEKAMASLMQMHTELMDEKERRVELYRKLMEREQALAELRMYVKMLEEKMEAKRAEPPRPSAPVAAVPVEMPVVVPVVPAPARPMPPTPHTRAPSRSPPIPPRVARPKVDGWKTW
jgi:hypothetical protein